MLVLLFIAFFCVVVSCASCIRQRQKEDIRKYELLYWASISY